MKEVQPVTRVTFLAAYVDEYPNMQCRHAVTLWLVLHERTVQLDEINEDP
jgi:hypothetical protein